MGPEIDKEEESVVKTIESDNTDLNHDTSKQDDLTDASADSTHHREEDQQPEQDKILREETKGPDDSTETIMEDTENPKCTENDKENPEPKTGDERTGLSVKQRKSQLECKECGETFTRRETYNLHRYSHMHQDEEASLICKECGITFQHRSDLIKHRSTHKEISQEAVSYMNGPKSICNEQKKLICKLCNKCFSTMMRLRIHVCDGNVDKPFRCPLCRKEFQYRVSIIAHMASHSLDSPYRCLECNKGFQNLEMLHVHQRSHTALKPYECPECSMVFRHRSLMEGHRRSHTEEKAHLCKVCGKNFKYGSLLQQHQYLHTGQKPYTCSYCGKRFAFAQNMRAHFRQHKKISVRSEEHIPNNNSLVEQVGKENTSVELKRNCPLCPKMFHKASDLRAHMLIHEAEYERMSNCKRIDKVYACQHCPLKFQTEALLQSHSQTHTTNVLGMNATQITNQVKAVFDKQEEVGLPAADNASVLEFRETGEQARGREGPGKRGSLRLEQDNGRTGPLPERIVPEPVLPNVHPQQSPSFGASTHEQPRPQPVNHSQQFHLQQEWQLQMATSSEELQRSHTTTTPSLSEAQPTNPVPMQWPKGQHKTLLPKCDSGLKPQHQTLQTNVHMSPPPNYLERNALEVEQKSKHPALWMNTPSSALQKTPAESLHSDRPSPLDVKILSQRPIQDPQHPEWGMFFESSQTQKSELFRNPSEDSNLSMDLKPPVISKSDKLTHDFQIPDSSVLSRSDQTGALVLSSGASGLAKTNSWSMKASLDMSSSVSLQDFHGDVLEKQQNRLIQHLPQQLQIPQQIHPQPPQLTPWVSTVPPNQMGPVNITFPPAHFPLGERPPLWGFQTGPVVSQTLMNGPVQQGHIQAQHRVALLSGQRIPLNQTPTFISSPFPPPPTTLNLPVHPMHSVARSLPGPMPQGIFFTSQGTINEMPLMPQVPNLPQLSQQSDLHKLEDCRLPTNNESPSSMCEKGAVQKKNTEPVSYSKVRNAESWGREEPSGPHGPVSEAQDHAGGEATNTADMSMKIKEEDECLLLEEGEEEELADIPTTEGDSNKRHKSIEDRPCSKDSSEVFGNKEDDLDDDGEQVHDGPIIAHLKKKSFQCPTCGRCYSRASALEAHQRCHEEKLVKSKTFEFESEKTSPRNEPSGKTHDDHRGSEQTDAQEKKVFRCYCGKPFQSMCGLKTHQRFSTSCSKEKVEKVIKHQFVCSECDKSFVSSVALLCHQHWHKRRAETGGSSQSYKCTECGKCFNSLTFYNKHQRTAHSEEHPAKSFLHQVIQLKKKAFECQECGRRFSRASALQAHQLCHTDAFFDIMEVKRGLSGTTQTLKENQNQKSVSVEFKSQDVVDVKVQYDKTEVCKSDYDELNATDVVASGSGNTPGISEEQNPDLELVCESDQEEKEELSLTPESTSSLQRIPEIDVKIIQVNYELLNNEPLVTSGEMSNSCPHCDQTFDTALSLHNHLLWHNKSKGKTSDLPTSSEKVHSPSKSSHAAPTETHDEKIELKSDSYQSQDLDKSSLKCEECGIVFSRLSALHSHEQIHNSQKKPFPCLQCKKSYQTAGGLFIHQSVCCGTVQDETSKHFNPTKTLLGPKVHHCKKCGKGFWSIGAFYHHKQSSTQCADVETKPSGEIDREKYRRRKKKGRRLIHDQKPPVKSFEYQLQELKEKSYQCPYCNSVFSRAMALQFHMRSHGFETGLGCDNQCPRCLKYFASQLLLYNHHKHCVKSEETTELLHDPVRIKQEEQKPDICDMSQSTPPLASESASEPTSPPVSELKYKCKDCSRSFAVVGALNFHKRIHASDHQSKKLKAVLSKKFKLHKVKSEKSCQFVCVECGRQFDSNSALGTHRRWHKDKRLARYLSKTHKLRSRQDAGPYLCDMCGKGFFYLCVLRRHQLHHPPTNAQPQKVSNGLYNCPDCLMSFVNGSLLATHFFDRHSEPTERILSKDKSESPIKESTWDVTKTKMGIVRHYRCSQCDKIFLNIHGLRAHLCKKQKTVAASTGSSSTHAQPFAASTKPEPKPCTEGEPIQRIRNLELTKCLFKCNKCAKSFQSESQLHAHKEVVNTHPYCCTLCCRGYWNENQLEQHLSWHNEVRQRLPTELRYRLSASIVPEHSDASSEAVKSQNCHKCRSCGKTFWSSQALQNHQILHKHETASSFAKSSGGKEGKDSNSALEVGTPVQMCCTECGISFRHETELHQHYIEHARGLSSAMKSTVLALVILAAACSADEKIIGGYECSPNSQPWQIYLTYDNGVRWCGASLINERWVVSAAHCYVSADRLTVHLGEHSITVEEGTEQRIGAEKVITHPKYNDFTYDNDFMLIKLKEPAVFNPFVQPIPLATSCSSTGEECLVSGWGNLINTGVNYATELQCLNLPVLSRAQCEGSYGWQITKNMFCAGFMEGGKDSCQGDSGGPVVCNGELRGVVSWGYGCAEQRYPGVYVEVCRYNEWVETTIAKN
ncbi:hypothetical protein DNTS_021633 [Danionella cerebrum]|uniref:trypsin n=1 Tax=Danionella cerebrum TaxID=2873325 RepID=A0A553QXS2_9TELE|nr:hypothetical protein DNTS_021633 [Danionella translucida]